MKIIRKYFFLACIFSVILCSCKKDSNYDESQDKVYADYELFYNQNENKTHAVARFRFGGETGKLMKLADSAGASITFNGEVLPYNIWYGGYHKSFLGHIDQGIFVYTNTNEIAYTNIVPKGDDAQFQSNFDTINKGVDQSVIWEGTSLLAYETVGIFVNTWTWGESPLFSCTGVGATKVNLPIEKLSDLSVGVAKIYMDRSIDKPVEQGTSVGGRIRKKYRGENQFVKVIE